MSYVCCVLFTSCLKVEAIAGWMESVAKTLPKRGYEQACGIWNGHDYIPILRQMGITVMTFEIILVSTIPLTVWYCRLVSRDLRLLMWWCSTVVLSRCVVSHCAYLWTVGPKRVSTHVWDVSHTLISTAALLIRDSLIEAYVAKSRHQEVLWVYCQPQLTFWHAKHQVIKPKNSEPRCCLYVYVCAFVCVFVL